MNKKLYFVDSLDNKVSSILSTSNTQSKSIVIMCHGLNSKKESTTNNVLSEILIKNNIATFKFDFFAHGESDGKFEDRTLDIFVDDILKAIDYVKSQGYTRIGIYGVSFGGVASIIAASQRADIKFLALKAPGMGKTSRQMSNYENNFIDKVWIKAGKHIKIPTLIVHGTSDESVELELATDLHNSIKNSKLVLIDRADHQFTKKEDFNLMIKNISEFILENI